MAKAENGTSWYAGSTPAACLATSTTKKVVWFHCCCGVSGRHIDSALLVRRVKIVRVVGRVHNNFRVYKKRA